MEIEEFFVKDKGLTLNGWQFLLKDENASELFLYPFTIHFERVFERLKEALSSVENNIDDNKLRKIIVRDMKASLSRLIQRTLIWEFTVVNRRQGDKEKVKFSDYIEGISSYEQTTVLFKKYPMLKKLFFSILTNYTNSQIELLSRVQQDFAELTSFFDKKLLLLTNFTIQGDSHCSGRRTLLLTFQCETDCESKLQIIYKPRPLGLDKCFQDYLSFTNNFYSERVLQTTQILDKGEYGYLEYIEHKAIQPGQEALFYYRVGFLLGLIYSLNGGDMHFENMIAHGQHPIFIDMECLLSIPVNDKQAEDPYWPRVSDTCIIPSIKEDKSPNYDYSALLFHKQQPAPVKSLRLNWDSDVSANFERVKQNIKPAKNYLYYTSEVDKHVSPLPYTNDIVKGFKDFYELLLNNKTMYLAFIRKSFSGLLKRIIFRPTMMYDVLMIESYHPRLLSSVEEYHNFLKQLDEDASFKKYGDIVDSEITDVLLGDVPCFFSCTEKKNLINSQNEQISSNFRESCLEKVLNKINLLSSDDCHRQSQLIVRAMEDNYAG